MEQDSSEPINFTVTIHCDNAAFEDDPLYEVRRILERIAKRINEEGSYFGQSQTILDSNGNDVGRYKFGYVK